ncbi:hypothetical protein TRIATDRAFT_298628 [Trichoderma atroviride IMI 206040]|uniref:Uncharacterized protein n=1 Tax=Hypocrea atroviridis (strain ATCC 20476 / IMI 206040) TaxID=452589 RepID=G9NNA4_HYPAI|nr:uncharacterized protein TRIATDRAFT_298628 [Trichoderma atroviride IMI 206040]EHK47554.1 hypothetical protein TRIATDRAFT_298628 [Trichoderma atroviride IMI 206040]
MVKKIYQSFITDETQQTKLPSVAQLNQLLFCPFPPVMRTCIVPTPRRRHATPEKPAQ